MAAGSGIAVRIGASLIAVTSIVKVRETLLTPPLAVPPLSITVTVIVAVPLVLGSAAKEMEFTVLAPLV